MENQMPNFAGYAMPEVSTTKMLANTCIAATCIAASAYAGILAVDGICKGIDYLVNGSSGDRVSSSNACLTVS